MGKTDAAGLADIVVEAALTTIIDFEDSIAAVDAADKTAAYANWLGLNRGELQATFAKDGRSLTRRLEPDRAYVSPQGRPFELPGPQPAFRAQRRSPHDHSGRAAARRVGRAGGYSRRRGHLAHRAPRSRGRNRLRNSRKGSIYIVKPKMHGPAEADFTNRLFDAVEDLLHLPRHTIKVGVMDEERRTSANLTAVIAAVKHRIVFINTGFLDRTGDEIHTSMRAGAVVPKGEMRNQTWIRAYEARNVAIGLACGLNGQGQIGKGMWTAPDRMADMLQQKIAHPQAGANTAWVPSPTAAILHALHYHQVDVRARQRELTGEAAPALEQLLTIPLAKDGSLTAELIQRELENNTQSILGYVVRWIDLGIGCSKVPDINDVGLMEDRATLRISAQHIGNWLMHGICARADVEQALRRMAVKVDRQNASDPAYRPMAPGFEAGLAFQAACALIFDGATEPNGYTEPLLHSYRLQVKRRSG